MGQPSFVFVCLSLQLQLLHARIEAAFDLMAYAVHDDRRIRLRLHLLKGGEAHLVFVRLQHEPCVLREDRDSARDLRADGKRVVSQVRHQARRRFQQIPGGGRGHVIGQRPAGSAVPVVGQTLNEVVAANGVLFNAFCDGSVVANYVSVENGKVVMSVGQDLTTASNVAVLCMNPVTVSLTHNHGGEGEGEVAASAGAILSIVLIVCAALLVVGAVYLIAKGKLTGFSAIITVWCAVMLECFFYATLVRSTVTLANLLMLVVGLALALYAAALRTKEISKLIGEGNTPKSANKLGLRTAAKKVWLAHGVLLVLSLIMMIFGFSKVVGYALCCGVVASAFVAPVMRLFQACFIAMTGKAANFGKVK